MRSDEILEWTVACYSFVLEYNKRYSGKEFADEIRRNCDTKDNQKNAIAATTAETKINVIIRRYEGIFYSTLKRNVLICAYENILLYETELTDKEIETWAKMVRIDAHDVFTVTDDELQHYNIDSRILMNETEDNKVRDIINKKH